MKLFGAERTESPNRWKYLRLNGTTLERHTIQVKDMLLKEALEQQQARDLEVQGAYKTRHPERV